MNMLLRRCALGISMIFLSAWAIAEEQAVAPVTVHIDAQPLDAALNAWADQTGYSVLVPFERAAQGKMGARVQGIYTPEEALRMLLASTDLRYEFVNERTVAIRAVKAEQGKPSALTIDGADDEMRFAQAEATLPGSTGSPAGQGATGSSDTATSGLRGETLDEIVVTANRRVQRAQDVAGTLQVFNGAELEKAGADGFADYLRNVPGLSLRQQGNGANRITLRGVANIGTSDGGNGPVSTTGLYLNDVSIQGASLTPDLVVYDVDRIEVLKGPQGTLYGEGAMGGAIKMILNSANLREFEGKADLSLSSTEQGGFNSRVRGVANLPLVEDRLALRLVGTYLDDTGFVDNIARGEQEHDDKRTYSLRGLLTARMSDTLSAEILALHNVLEQEDFPQIETGLGKSRIALLEDRRHNSKATVLALTVKNDFGPAELISVTSDFTVDRDFVDTFNFGGVFFAYGQTAQPFLVETQLKKSFAQELRLVSQGDDKLDWVVGAFYRDKKQVVPSAAFVEPEEADAVNAGLAADGIALLGPGGHYFEGNARQTFQQTAFYGESNLELGDRWELTAGLRWFEEDSDARSFTSGYSLLAAFTTVPVTVAIRDQGVIPKFGLSFELSDRHLLYAQAAKGFRSGAVNINFATVGDEGAESDDLWSYEIGTKNSFANGRAIFNAAAFFLDWSGIQASAVAVNRLTGLPTTYVENAGDAEIYGFEAELQSALTDHFTLGTTLGYMHSELVSTLGRAVVGERLPSTPKLNASGYVEYRAPVALGQAVVHLDAQYVDDQNSLLIMTNALGVPVTDGRPLPSYTLANLRLGLEGDSGWGASIFVENLTDKSAATGYGYESLTALNSPTRVTITRPRTYGVSFFKTF